MGNGHSMKAGPKRGYALLSKASADAARTPGEPMTFLDNLSLNRPATILAFVFFIAACVVCLANVGKHIEPPFPLAIDETDSEQQTIRTSFISGKKSVASGNREVFREGIGGIVADQGCTRLVLLDGQGRATALYDNNPLEDSVFYVQDAAIADDAMFVLSYEKSAESGLAISQRITEYGLDGAEHRVIWQVSYGDLESQPRIPRVFSIEQADDGFFIVLINEDDTGGDILRIGRSGTVEVIRSFAPASLQERPVDVRYNHKTDTVGVVGEFGTVLVMSVSGEERMVTPDDALSFYRSVRLSDDGGFEPLFQNESAQIAPQRISFAPMLALRTLLFWISLAVVAAFLTAFAVSKIRRAFKGGGVEGPSKVLVAVLTVGIIFGISLYYSVEIQRHAETERLNTLGTLALDIRSSTERGLLSELASFDSMDDCQSEAYRHLVGYLDQLRANGISRGINANITLWHLEGGDIDRRKAIYSTNTDEWLEGSMESRPLTMLEDDVSGSGFAAVSAVGDHSVYFVANAILFDELGNPAGLLSVDSDTKLLHISTLYRMVSLFSTLLIALMVLYLAAKEIHGFAASLKTRRSFIERNIEHPEVALVRSFSFLTTFLLSFDSVLVVLITKDLLGVSLEDASALLLGLPVACQSLGGFAGKICYDTLSKRMAARRLALLSCFLSAIGLFGCFSAVATHSFALYCCSLFTSAVFIGVLFALRNFMPLLSPNDDVRFEANNGGTISSIASGIIAVAVAGIMAEALGSASIYLLGAAVVALTALFVFCLFPRTIRYGLQAGPPIGQVPAGKAVRFFLSPAFVSFAVCLLFVNILTSGYSSIMFPLLTDDAGISKTAMSNLVVFAKFFSYIGSGNSKRLFQKTGFVRPAVLLTAILGLIFASFVFNASVLWASVVIALVAVFGKLQMLCAFMIWPKLCRSANFPERTTNAFIQYFLAFSRMAKSFILSSLMIVGIAKGCAILGLLIIVGAALLAATLRKQAH